MAPLSHSMLRREFVQVVTIVLAFLSFEVSLPAQSEGRRLQVLFFGSPTALGPHHDPITRYRVLKKALGVHGIDLTYSEEPAEVLSPPNLRQFDAVLMYANWFKYGRMPKDQLEALLGFVEGGGGFLPIHCASACYGLSPRFVQLVGARFRSHGSEVFRAEIVDRDHEILRGWEGFEAWDETYVHEEQQGDRTILQVRDGEPWTWVRRQGEGRVFYTASGHDHRVWDRTEFQELLRRAILWSVGKKAAILDRLELPELASEVVSLPGYRERQEIVRAQVPLSPDESQKLIQVPPGHTVQLFCSEPDIVNPIHVSWDHRGRAYVIETIDYPNNLQAGNFGNDRITICEDTDGDGRADRFTRFAEQLSIPTSLCFANGGVVCTNGSEMLFLKDTDGDDVADERRVLFTGFGMGDTHAGPSNLRYGFDGWIYATVGYSGFDGEVGGRRQSFSLGVFRFLPDGSALEYLQRTTNNTWGLGFTESFDLVGSTANANPSFYVSFPRSAYEAAGVPQPKTPRADDNPKFFPISTDIRQVDQFDRYTAGAGHAVYTARRFDRDLHDRAAFVCAPTGKLVGRFDLERIGGGFRASQSPNNLFTSADAWTSPVCCEIGPDGAVWICDWYNLVVQHNPTPSKSSAGIDAKTGKGNAYVTPLRDKQRGRIWRVFPSETADDAVPELDGAKPATLLAALSHPNLLWRLHAQRLLVEGGQREVADELEDLVSRGGVAAPHALHTLVQIGALNASVVESGLASPEQALRRAALRVATSDAVKQRYLRGEAIDAEGRELAEVLVALSRSAPDTRVGEAIYRTLRRGGDSLLEERAMRDAWQIAAQQHAAAVLAAAAADGFSLTDEETQRNLLSNPGFETVRDGRAIGWTDLRTYSGARGDAVEVTSSEEGRNGSRALRIHCDRRSDSGVAMQVRVEPGARYRLSGWVRTENAVANGPGMMLNVHGNERTRGLTGTTDWTELSVEFEATQEVHIVHCLFGGYGGAKGTAYFDDVSLVRIGSSETASGALRALALRLEAGDAEPEIARKFEPDPQIHDRGAAVYARTCIACHGVDGLGVPQAFPPLAGSDWVTGDSSTPIRIILHGLQGPIRVDGATYSNVMAPLGSALTDREIADVLTYVRQSFGNDASPVGVDAVNELRQRYARRKDFWTAAELGR